MAPTTISQEDYDSWVTPREAWNILIGEYGKYAKSMIVSRLQSGDVRGAALSVGDKNRAPHLRTPLSLVALEVWQKAGSQVMDSKVWATGDLYVEYYDDTYTRATSLSFFGVKFEPAAIRALLTKTLTQSGHPTILPESQVDPLPADKGPAVSEAHLTAWYEVYKQAYRGNDDTLPRALESARGMFPGKFVSRDRVRALCAGRTSGRKPKLSN